MKKIQKWQIFNENATITAQQKSFIEDQLYNASEHMDEEEMIEWFVENDIDREFATKIVNEEMPKCLRDTMYFIDWSDYGINESLRLSKWATFNENYLKKDETFYIGNAPTDEEVVQVSKNEDYYQEQKEQCIRYRDMLRKRFPNCNNVFITIEESTHDEGSYNEVVVKFNAKDVAEANFIEENLPSKWTDTEVLNYEKEVIHTKEEAIELATEADSFDKAMEILGLFLDKEIKDKHLQDYFGTIENEYIVRDNWSKLELKDRGIFVKEILGTLLPEQGDLFDNYAKNNEYMFKGDTLGGDIINKNGRIVLTLTEVDVLDLIEECGISIEDCNSGNFDINIMIEKLKEKGMLKESKISNWETFKSIKGGYDI